MYTHVLMFRLLKKAVRQGRTGGPFITPSKVCRRMDGQIEQAGHKVGAMGMLSAFRGRALREQRERPRHSYLLWLNYYLDKRRYTVCSLFIRHPQLEPIGAFLGHDRSEE